MNKKYYAMIFGAAGLAFAAAGINNTLTLKEYTVRSEKITRPFTMVFLSDVHSQKFKDGGRALFELIDSACPDCILLGGDIFDKYAKPEQDGEVYRLIQSIKSKYRNCFYVSGNHEYESGKAAGRGAYVCKNIDCFEALKKGKKLNKAFSGEIPNEVYDSLIKELENAE